MNDLQHRMTRVLAEFDLPPASHFERLGGTASDTVMVICDDQRWVVRWRQTEFADAGYIRFDHQCLLRLAAAGLPAPVPLRTTSGNTWFEDERGPVEVLTFISGRPFQLGDTTAVADVGRTLARFHEALADSSFDGKDGYVREDHPDFLEPYLAELTANSQSHQQRLGLRHVKSELQNIRSELDSGLYDKLPQAVIHGDIHPGNIAFSNSRVSAIYDFDYMSRQARARDLVDALMFFGASRQRPLDTDDIWSLTQPYELLPGPSAILIDAYHEISPITDLDRLGMYWLLKSQWCQIRLRGSRKVLQKDKLRFVLSNFEEMIARIEHWKETLLQDF